MLAGAREGAGRPGPSRLAQAAGESAITEDPYEGLLREARARLAETFPPHELEDPSPETQAKAEELLRRMAEAAVQGWTSRGIPLMEPPEALVARLLDDIFGWGPISPYLATETVEEIILNGPDQVWIIDAEKGKYLAPVRFRSAREVINLVNRALARTGRRLDRKNPRADGRLRDGSRLHAVMEPLVDNVPVAVTIRRHRMVARTLEDLVGLGTLTPAAAAFLRECVLGRLNLVVTGGTASGKTNTLNALCSLLPKAERVITIEDTPELKIPVDDWVALVTRPADEEGTKEVTMADLVREALRMRPDRIITGEARGAEIVDILMAANTGHDGQMLTVHSNGVLDVVSRLTTMYLLGKELSLNAIRRQIADAFQVVVYIERVFLAGRPRRFVRQIAEILPSRFMEGDTVAVNVLFEDRGQGLGPTGNFPQVLPEEIRRRSGRTLDLKIFR